MNANADNADEAHYSDEAAAAEALKQELIRFYRRHDPSMEAEFREDHNNDLCLDFVRSGKKELNERLREKYGEDLSSSDQDVVPCGGCTPQSRKN